MPGNKLYQIHYLESVVEEDIPNLATSAKTLIKRAIEEQLMVDPIGFGKPLRYSLKGHRRLRISDYRIVPQKHAVLIIAIKHRREVYDDY